MKSPLHLVLTLAVFAASMALAAAEAQPKTVLKTERFGRDPGWEGHNNHIVPKLYPMVTQAFGYSRTNFAGKSQGEIGGSVQRASEAAFYAAKIGPKTLDDHLAASGTFAITKTTNNTGVFFGWFNSQQPGRTGRPVNSFGMNMGGEPTGARLAVHMIAAQNQVKGQFITRYEKYRTPAERVIMRPTPIKNDGTRYHWKLDYDPAAGGANGQFQFTIRNCKRIRDDSDPTPVCCPCAICRSAPCRIRSRRASSPWSASRRDTSDRRLPVCSDYQSGSDNGRSLAPRASACIAAARNGIEFHALAREPVEIRGAHLRVVIADVLPALVVGDDEENVRLFRGGNRG